MKTTKTPSIRLVLACTLLSISSVLLAQDEKATDAKKAEVKAEEAKKADATKKAEKARATEKASAKEEAADGSEAAESETSADDATTEKNADKSETEEPAKPEKPPEPPIFRLRDGTRIAGFPEIETITIQTAYGRLVIPSKEVVRVRFAREEDPNLKNRVRDEIVRLGDEDFEVREQAMAALLEIGPVALPQIREAIAKTDDEEVKSRGQTLVAKLDEGGDDEFLDEEDEDAAPISGKDDEVVTLKFTAKGTVEERSFNVKSAYGPLTIDRKDIVSIVFQDYTPSQVALTVPGSYFAGANNWFQTKIALKKGQRIKLSGSGQIHIQNYGYFAGPEGTTQTSSKQFESFRMGALVARIGKKGKAFLVGKQFRGKANATGKLTFAVALRSARVVGSFNVKVETEEE